MQDSPQAPDGATTPDPQRRLRAEQREQAIEDDRDPDLCPCGNRGVCIGQFEGEMSAVLGCDDCCNHEDMRECGRCWPVTTTPTTPVVRVPLTSAAALSAEVIRIGEEYGATGFLVIESEQLGEICIAWALARGMVTRVAIVHGLPVTIGVDAAPEAGS